MSSSTILKVKSYFEQQLEKPGDEKENHDYSEALLIREEEAALRFLPSLLVASHEAAPLLVVLSGDVLRLGIKPLH